MAERPSNWTRWVSRPAVPLVLLALLLGAPARRLQAVSCPAAGARAEKLAEEPAERRLYFAMWTLHLRDVGRGLENNRPIAMSWGRVYGGTFMNSFGRRSYTVGLQDFVARWGAESVSLGLGYRAGLVTGYDGRFLPIAGRTPVLPLLQPLVALDVRGWGLELSYSGIVASAALSARF